MSAVIEELTNVAEPADLAGWPIALQKALATPTACPAVDSGWNGVAVAGSEGAPRPEVLYALM